MNLNREEAKLWARLNAAAGIGPSRFHKLLKGFPSLDAVLGASAQAWQERCGVKPAEAEAALASLSKFDADAELDLAASLGARLLNFREAEYPASLAQLPNPPPLLYIQGPAPTGPSMAVVGTRKPSGYGLRMAAQISADLARAGMDIVSGLALGVDAAALEAGMQAGGRAIGVLGSGLAEFYPRQNYGLSRRMLESGGSLLSQFSLRARPDKFRFPMRNGIVSGLSLGVLVVEGEEDSGSLITAEWALEQGRDVFALPGRADDILGRGPNKLIQQGAKLVLEARDLLLEYGQFAAAAARAKAPAAGARPDPQLYGAEAALYAALRQGGGRGNLEGLRAASGLEAGEAAAALTMLEIKGLVRSRPGGLVELQP